MSITYSKPMPLGSKAPDFSLPDTVSGKIISLSEQPKSPATGIIFMCNHCPFVKHVLPELTKLVKEYQAKGAAFIAISANDIRDYPQDAPGEMKKLAIHMGFSFPYLYDESQEIAKAYQAQCTPEFYLFDEDLKCAYHGRFDDSSPGKPETVTGNDFRMALDAVLAKKPAPQPQYPSMGCNIKWKD